MSNKNTTKTGRVFTITVNGIDHTRVAVDDIDAKNLATQGWRETDETASKTGTKSKGDTK
ncbi:hypothetical protein H8R18_01310 [Nanchangia anserum]|uniref:Uncharacterized protein n=1 Tax=Nanchangia anserum TaxID=2692125 RepID=A0A8I0GCZ4_9ACTO|nr:hypothetical protein [Nanchangia anserum]MBD3689875.1 hypothetical protein [Nanchangia anserum]QOX82043.1 hypothetical protein H8R18_01310 [Nanchangia anserum]